MGTLAQVLLVVSWAGLAYGQAGDPHPMLPSVIHKPAAGIVQDVGVIPHPNGIEIDIVANVPVVPQISTLTGPDRLVVDLPGCEFRGRTQRIGVNKGPVISVRASTFQRTPSRVRVVVDLSSPIVHQVKPAAFGLALEIDFSSTPSTAPATTTAGSPLHVAQPLARDAAIESEGPKTPKITIHFSARNTLHSDADDLMMRADGLALADLPKLQDQADAGDVESETTLALAYHLGTLLKVDDDQALQLLRRAAKHGYVAAEEAVGMFYQAGFGVQPNPGEALAWYSRAARHGSASAASNIGMLYATGAGVPKDFAKALVWFQKGAQAGDATAQYNLASMYRRGEGTAPNDKEYLHWITAAAEQNHLPAILQVARHYLNLRPASASNTQTAVRWLEQAANLGDSVAQAMLGDLFSNGVYLKPDYAKAVEWLQRAAQQGQREGEFGLGARYLGGQGVPADAAEARRWFTIAANQGQPDAQYDLALMFELGRGGPPDRAAAARYYEMAADQGITDAQCRLGLLLAKGDGVSRDVISAYKWLFLSKDKMRESATAVNQLGKSMSLEQIQEAERRIVVWREARERQAGHSDSLEVGTPSAQGRQQEP
jgi:TPR repeat protein